MSVRLRLRRTGTRNKACYRVVAADQRSPRDGRFIEALGLYDPRHEDENLDLARVDYWLANGAQPSETVRDIIRRCRDRAAGIVTEPAPEPVAEVEAAPVVEEETAPVETAEETAAAEAPAAEEAGVADKEISA